MSKKDMSIHEKRLSSFTRKRRASSAVGNKNAGNGKWPHEQPSPQKLADAGFYFNPSDAHLDNVTCYLCDKDLDGWEEDDDPISEHFKHCSECGWAQVAYALASRDDHKSLSDPRGTIMTEARIMTFGKKWWPHEEKRGWLPKIGTMAEAGWHYAPAKDSNDNASCAYCELTLDGWEMNDDPLEEHRRRSQDCLFFTWKPAPKRATKRASRASIQSLASSIGDGEDEPVRKTARSRKPKKAPSVVRELSVDPEPIVIDESVKAPRGRKRASSIVQNPEPVILWDGSKDTDEDDVQPPPAKRRTTRASLAKQSSAKPNADAKMADSDNESVAVGPARGRPKKGARSASKTRRSVVKKNSKIFVPDDDEIDRALALDFERPLTDEEDVATFKKPFVRTTKRLTRSRTSIAVEESMRNAPEGVLIPTARRGDRVSRTPLGTATPGSVRRSPTKPLFKDNNQDFSMPIVIPKHLSQADAEEESRGPREMGRYKGKVESAHVEVAPTEDPEPKRPAAKKMARGKKVAPPQEVEVPKPRRGRVAVAKAQKPPSRSISIDSQPPLATQIESEKPEVEELPPPPARIEELSEAPLRTKRVRKIKGRASVLSTTSMNSIASDNTGTQMTSSMRSIISDATAAHNMTSSMRSTASGVTSTHMTSSMRSMASESEQMATSLDESIIIHDSAIAPEADAETALSDLGSVIKYKINPRDRQPEEEIALPPKTKRGKKATVPPKKRPTGSSLLSVATDKTAASVGNSGDESDASRASASGTGKKSKKGSKRLGKKTAQSRNIEDILKKGSESFFASSQSEELTSSIHEGSKKARPIKRLMKAIEIEPRNSAKPEDPSQTEEDEPKSVPKGSRPVTTGRSVSFSDRAPNPDLYPGSDTELDEVVPPPVPPSTAPASPPRPARRPPAIPRSPARVPQSPARIPLSPVRTQITVPLASTPKTKPSGKLATVRPWTVVDLDTVFHTSETEIDDNAGLAEKEKEMTVADWVKWNAAQGEERLCREAERLIEIFEREGRRAIDAVEGIETV
ncbi:unnamed protein product [Tuber melanosporum]|uniref:(Perigord truffle) hypothetical protein n=1 Tax=Tuber melanosporum (strain Mel28) TaxID=656061 RepID=D5GF35_TUBMM|nr:uncharacterized protein GSTUM_00006726001 [Tuber melanosporum]CAZ83128.1 unnamed protein product [Tuber melanosporum]